jgi:Rab5 GDP/GTP exchange factor
VVGTVVQNSLKLEPSLHPQNCPARRSITIASGGLGQGANSQQPTANRPTSRSFCRSSSAVPAPCMPSPEQAPASPESSSSPAPPPAAHEPHHDAVMNASTEPANQLDQASSGPGVTAGATTGTTTTAATGAASTQAASTTTTTPGDAAGPASTPQNNAEGAHMKPASSPSDLIGLADVGTTSQGDVPPAPPTKDDPARKGKGPYVAEHAAEEQMEDSVSTLKPKRPQYLSIETAPYVDPTPPTPFGSQPPSRANSARSRGHGPSPSPTRSESGYDERRYTSEGEDEQDGNESRSEIQSIMEQFPEEGGGPAAEEVMSPRLEIASPFLSSPPPQHPPRKSSLEPLAPSIAQQIQDMQSLSVSADPPSDSGSKPKDVDTDAQRPPVPPKDSSQADKMPVETPASPTGPIHRPPPPEPEPEPTLPFDFHRFLEQLKNKKADPVARYLKSFLQEFGKRQWMVHEQVKIISDFLAFIANKMAQCEVWREVSDAEFDNAREGMEKLVMNRLYTQTFSPAIAPPQPIPGAKPKKRGGERPMGPGRRGQHQEDVERDEILAQKINIYGWVREEHLDITPVSESGKRFLILAQQGWSCPSY